MVATLSVNSLHDPTAPRWKWGAALRPTVDKNKSAPEKALPKALRHQVVAAGAPRAIADALRKLPYSKGVFEAALSAVEAVCAPAASTAERTELMGLADAVLVAEEIQRGMPARPPLRVLRVVCSALAQLQLGAGAQLCGSFQIRAVLLCAVAPYPGGGSTAVAPAPPDLSLLDAACQALCAVLGRSPNADSVATLAALGCVELLARALRAGTGVAGYCGGIAPCAASACRALALLGGGDGTALPRMAQGPVIGSLVSLLAWAAAAAEGAAATAGAAPAELAAPSDRGGAGHAELAEILLAPELSEVVADTAAAHRAIPGISQLAGDVCGRLLQARAAQQAPAASAAAAGHSTPAPCLLARQMGTDQLAAQLGQLGLGKAPGEAAGRPGGGRAPWLVARLRSMKLSAGLRALQHGPDVAHPQKH
eukprot:m51a1_g11966 hypothetical protein (424) ;mRNA; f:809572-813802